MISPKAKFVIFSDNETNFGVKIIEPDNREVKVSLYEVEGYYIGEKILIKYCIHNQRARIKVLTMLTGNWPIMM